MGIMRPQGRFPGAWAFGEWLEMGWGQQAESNPGPTSSCREIGSTNRALLPWLLSQKHKHNKACCPLEGVRPSPQQVRSTDLHPMLLNKLSLPISPIPPPALHLFFTLITIASCCQPCPLDCQALWGAGASRCHLSFAAVFPPCTSAGIPG